MSGFPADLARRRLAYVHVGEPATDGQGSHRCPRTFPVSFPQLVMKLSRGIHERDLAIALMGVEAVFGLVAIGLYVL